MLTRRLKVKIKVQAVRHLTNSTFMQSFYLLKKSDQLKLIIITFSQVIIAGLDLVGVLVIGALGALSIQGIESHKPGNKVGQLLRILHLQNLSFQSQVAFLGISAALILVFKTFVSVFLTRRTFFFLSHKVAEISSDLVSKILSQNLLELQSRTAQQLLFIVSNGVNSLMTGIIATSMSLLSDISMLVILSSGLFFVDPTIAFSTLILFFIAGYILNRLLHVRSREIGRLQNELAVQNNEKILEVLNSYRESVVRDRRQFYADKIREIRHELSDITAELNFQPYISKYVIESTSVLGSLGLAAYEFGTKNSVHAVATLAIFMAASSRIAPAALRIQQGMLTLRNSSGATDSTFALLDELKGISNSDIKDDDPLFSYPDFNPEVIMKSVSFQYSGEEKFALEGVDLHITAGSSVAIVGPSGAGKTTLVDLILGVLIPQVGMITISGVSPTNASRKWSGGISYVPQNVVISSGSIRENVGLGYQKEFATDSRVWNAIESAQLKETVENLSGGIDALVGEYGGRISGGQRQRLGIARALFTLPKLLVLDEATSALDGQTENDIAGAIAELSGKTTVIIIAHRLSTVRNVDQVIYIDKGQVIATGTFNEVRIKVPDFDRQASLMGL